MAAEGGQALAGIDVVGAVLRVGVAEGGVGLEVIGQLLLVDAKDAEAVASFGGFLPYYLELGGQIVRAEAQ